MKGFLLFLMMLAGLIFLYNAWVPDIAPGPPPAGGFEPVQTAELRKHINRYHGKEVLLTGKVTSNFYAYCAGGYMLQDDTGEIRVLTDAQPPMVGDLVMVVVEPKLLAGMNNHSIIVANQLQIIQTGALPVLPGNGK